MVAYHYDFRIALVKGSPNTVAANATVLVYDPADTAYATPLTVYSDPALTTIVNLVTDAYGIVPDFWSDKPDLLWKSGTMKGGWATTTSRPGLRGATGPQGPQGVQGVQGNPGLNGAGTNADVAAYVNATGATRDALDGRYQQTANLDTNVAAKVSTPGSQTRGALDALYGSTNPLGTASNPVKDPAAARPSGITSVWWLTSTQPTNWAAGDVWVVTP